MKTAKEWVILYTNQDWCTPNIIKQIQLDAWKQGMTDAAGICDSLEPSGVLEIGSSIRVISEETPIFLK